MKIPPSVPVLNHWGILATSFVATAIYSLAAPLDFHFPDDISWKAVFDRGFRPKHVPGLKEVQAQITEQEVLLYVNNTVPFHLDRGRVKFELRSDDSLRSIEHVSRVAITIEEGEKRLAAFHAMFGGKIIKQGVMPPIVDTKHGRVMTISDQAAVAEVDGYRVFFRFTSAMDRHTPLLPILAIIVKESMDGPRLPIRRKVVEPPPGYEWYSLDPRVDTPAPGVAPVIKPAVVPPGLAPGSTQRSANPYEEEFARKGKRLLLGLTAAVVAFLLLPVLWLLWRLRNKTGEERGS